MSEKKSETFKDASITGELRQTIVNALRQDGFSEEQLNSMDFDKVWNLYVDNFGETMSRQISEIAKFGERNPQLAPTVDSLIKMLLHELETVTDSLEKELDKKKATAEKTD